MVRKFGILFLVATVLLGCVPAKQARKDEPQPNPQAGPVVLDALAKRQMQSRIFDTPDEKMVLTAASATLQDIGFNLDESCSELGLITCSKNTDVENGKKIANNIGVTLLWTLASVALTGGHAAIVRTDLPGTVALDKVQKVRASLVSSPVGEKADRIMVRLIVQRVVVDNNNEISTAETITDPQIYQQFFDKLAQSLFLEAHGV